MVYNIILIQKCKCEVNFCIYKIPTAANGRISTFCQFELLIDKILKRILFDGKLNVGTLKIQKKIQFYAFKN